MASSLRAALAAALLVAGCGAPSTKPQLMLNLRGPGAVQKYDLFVRDDGVHAVVLHTGWSDATAGGTKDLSATPLRIGLTLPHAGPYAIAVVGAIGATSSSRPYIDPAGQQFYWAGEISANGDSSVGAALLAVPFADDADGDLFPSAATWATGAALPADLLDCDDARPDVNPFAAEICGDGIDQDCDGADLPCDDRDGDGDPDSTDCKPDDPKVHHPITDANSPHYDPAPESANCCGYALGQKGAAAGMLFDGKAICHAGTCGDGIDQDCNGVDVACALDHDCDTFAAGAQPTSCAAPPNVPPGDDCDDCDPKVNPAATELCDGIDNNCNGATDETCVGCDLDGDGFQRSDAKSACPDAAYQASGKPIDCNDEDAGVFPGSTGMLFPVKVPYLIGALATCAGIEGGGAACALRGACRNRNPDGTAQDADCDLLPANGCPPAKCDTDGDGFIDAAQSATCDPGGLLAPYDCDDADPHTFPNAPPTCGETKPHDCQAIAVCGTDADQDGYDTTTDCDDNDPTIHPWAVELCNGKDDDCDGLFDEGNPDSTGAPMIANGAIRACTDSNVGACQAPGGVCVCSSSSIASEFFTDGQRAACPGETAAVDQGAQKSDRAPRCYFAPQPKPDLCDGIDDDCDPATADGAVDCPGPKETGPICCAGGCTNVLTDPANCDACGMVCPTPPNAAGSCIAGVCGIAGCQIGYADCDKMSSDGCEVNIATDPMNCGGCKVGCPTPMNAIGAACSDMACGVGACKPGFADCDAMAGNGCEANTTNDAANCGGCGKACNLANAIAKCNNSACAIMSCNGAFKDCDLVPGNGCELDTSSDPANCGMCGMKCNVANAVAGCAAGKCTIASCDAGFGDCDKMPNNGCEANLTSDPNNCNACGTACAMNDAGHLCIAGACACNGKGDCSNLSDGCTNHLCVCGVGNPCDGMTQQCMGGQCLLKSGQPCTKGSQCASNNCNPGQNTCK